MYVCMAMAAKRMAEHEALAAEKMAAHEARHAEHVAVARGRKDERVEAVRATGARAPGQVMEAGEVPNLYGTTYTNTCIHIHACMHACMCVYACMCLCVCVCSNLVPVDLDFTKSHAAADGRVVSVGRARKL
jgi:hypothetical protein